MASFKDRLLTRQGAYAVTSPGAILAGGAAAAAGIAAGLALPLAAVAGAVLYAGAAYRQLPRQPEDPTSRPGVVLRDPWRSFVNEARDARNRYDRAVAGARSGPLRRRLEQIGERVGKGVEESQRVAVHGQALEDALTELEPISEVEARLQAVESDLAEGRAGDQQLEQTANALRSQLASTQRIATVARDTRDRLRLLDARLDEAVARVVELSLRAGDTEDIGGLGNDVEAIVTEMESLRIALEETTTGTATT